MRYVESAGAERRLEAARAFLASFAAATELLVIGASREAADDLCRDLTRARGTTFGLHRFTLGQYASRVAGPALAGQGLALCTPLGAEAVAARAAFEAKRRGSLSYLEPVVGCPGLPRALASTLDELRQAQVKSAALRQLPLPGPDLATLLDEYERQLKGAQAADRAAILLTAARAIAADPAGALATLPILLLDVRIATPAEHAIIDALVASSPSVLITVPAGDRATLRYLEARSAERIAAATLSAASAGSASKAGSHAATGAAPSAAPVPGSSLARLRENLFAESAVASGELDGHVEFFSAPGESRECVEVARRVMREAARGVPFDEIAIVVRAPETYWGLLEHALQGAGVKPWFARGTRRPDPSGRAFLALLACASDGLSGRRFAQYPSLGQGPPRDAPGGRPPVPPAWGPPHEETLARGQLSLFELIDSPDEDAAFEQRPTSPGGETGVSSAPPARDHSTDGTIRTPRKWEALIVESSVIGRVDRWERRLAG